jgi:NADP-dependent 3-hydroxy acid dehydrogenase YdfG
MHLTYLSWSGTSVCRVAQALVLGLSAFPSGCDPARGTDAASPPNASADDGALHDDASAPPASAPSASAPHAQVDPGGNDGGLDGGLQDGALEDGGDAQEPGDASADGASRTDADAPHDADIDAGAGLLTRARSGEVRWVVGDKQGSLLCPQQSIALWKEETITLADPASRGFTCDICPNPPADDSGITVYTYRSDELEVRFDFASYVGRGYSLEAFSHRPPVRDGDLEDEPQDAHAPGLDRVQHLELRDLSGVPFLRGALAPRARTRAGVRLGRRVRRAHLHALSVPQSDVRGPRPRPLHRGILQLQGARHGPGKRRAGDGGRDTAGGGAPRRVLAVNAAHPCLQTDRSSRVVLSVSSRQSRAASLPIEVAHDNHCARRYASPMQDKVIVITGASAGIGAALARHVAKAGARPVLLARRREELEAVAAACGERALPLVVDVTQRAQVEQAVKDVLARCGAIDVWVNNAGRGITRSVSELSDADLDDMMLVNVKSVLYGMQSVLPHFKQQRRGQIINVSSLLGRVPFAPFRSAYSAAKHAMNSLSANLRMELHSEYPDVRVCVMHPGVVATDFGLNALHGGVDSRSLPGAQTAEDVAAVLASMIVRPRADVYSREGGQKLVVDYFAAADMGEAETHPPFMQVPRKDA